jgi:hypothetical protein
MSIYSKNNSTKNTKATYQKFHVYEAATSISEAKFIAEDQNSANRYQHRAMATIVGNPNIRPYDPIYFDGLPGGFSGYWTVLSVTHIFGGIAKYLTRLEVGTDILGDVDSAASKNSDVRNVQAELSNQSLISSDVSLTQYTLSPNASSLPVDSTTTAKVSVDGGLVPNIPGITAYSDSPPNLSTVTKTVNWTSTGNRKVIS